MPHLIQNIKKKHLCCVCL